MNLKNANILFIEPECLIAMLITEGKNKIYLTIPRLLQFVSYLREQLSNSSNIRFDISYDSIERSIRIYDDIFSLIGNTITLKKQDDIFSRLSISEELRNILLPYTIQFLKELPM